MAVGRLGREKLLEDPEDLVQLGLDGLPADAHVGADEPRESRHIRIYLPASLLSVMMRHLVPLRVPIGGTGSFIQHGVK